MEFDKNISLIDFFTHFCVIKSGGEVRKPTEQEIENLTLWQQKIDAGFKPILRKGRGINKIVWVKEKI